MAASSGSSPHGSFARITGPIIACKAETPSCLTCACSHTWYSLSVMSAKSHKKLPEARTYMDTASDHTSALAAQYGMAVYFDATISGEAYALVPKQPVVRGSVEAAPKSHNLSVPSLVTNMLSGFTSK